MDGPSGAEITEYRVAEARQADLAAQPWNVTIGQDAFYTDVTCAIEKAVEEWRARRRAERPRRTSCDAAPPT